MSEAIALRLLDILILAFPPLARIFSRYLPDDDPDPLVARIREMLPSEGASASAVRELSQFGSVLDDADDEEDP